MRRSVYLHVGAPLTGSAYLRESLARHRRRLARAGSSSRPATSATPAATSTRCSTCSRWPAPGTLRPRAPGTGSRRRCATGGAAPWCSPTSCSRTPPSPRSSGCWAPSATPRCTWCTPPATSAGSCRWPGRSGSATAGRPRSPPTPPGCWPGTATGWHGCSGAPTTSATCWSGGGPTCAPEQVHVIPVPDTPDQDAVLWHRFTRTVGIDPRNLAVGPDPHRRLDPIAATEVLRLLNLATGESADPERLRALVDDLAGAGGALPRLPRRWPSRPGRRRRPRSRRSAAAGTTSWATSRTCCPTTTSSPAASGSCSRPPRTCSPRRPACSPRSRACAARRTEGPPASADEPSGSCPGADRVRPGAGSD